MVTTYDNLPPFIQEILLDRQFKQSGIRDPDVFRKNLTACSNEKGFLWAATEEGLNIWNEVLYKGLYDNFYKIHFKQNIYEIW